MTRQSPKDWPVLAGFLGLCLVVAAIGGAVTVPNIPTWYEGLAKPSFVPPNGVFGPVWTVLYILMAIAAWLVWRASAGQRALPIGLFLIQLTFNALWSPLFFGAHLILVGLIDIALLVVSLTATSIVFWRTRRVAGLLLVPYLAWGIFATALNAAIWRLNPVS
jgi:tryptophan-rich sensory protein